MQKFATLHDAVALAEFAHRNQTDKAGLPYVEHPKRVLANVQAMGVAPYVQAAAVLHDVTEDTAFSPQMLLDLGFSEAVVNIVKLVDRGHSQNFWKEGRNRGFIHNGPDEFYYEEIRKNPGARAVKLADINDNLLEWRLSYLSPDTQTRLRAKYAHAKEILGGS